MYKSTPSLLVVEDDSYVRELIRNVLVEAGFEVEMAENGWAALELIEQKSFDVAIVDIGLPGDLSGLDVVQYARVQPRPMRCLFVSGFQDPITDDPDCDDFVSKPFRPNELVGCVWELLHRKVPTHPIDRSPRQAKRVLLAARIALLKRRREASATDPGDPKAEPLARPLSDVDPAEPPRRLADAEVS